MNLAMLSCPQFYGQPGRSEGPDVGNSSFAGFFTPLALAVREVGNLTATGAPARARSRISEASDYARSGRSNVNAEPVDW
jgi:hypothetical protein